MTLLPNLFGYIVFAALGCVFVWLIIQQRARTKQIQAYAKGCGFTYVGSAVLRGFPLEKTSLGNARISNAFAGEKNSVEFIFFDCKIVSGKNYYPHTVIAVRGSSEDIGATCFYPTLFREQVDDWTFYRFGDALALEQIEALVSSIRR